MPRWSVGRTVKKKTCNSCHGRGKETGCYEHINSAVIRPYLDIFTAGYHYRSLRSISHAQTDLKHLLTADPSQADVSTNRIGFFSVWVGVWECELWLWYVFIVPWLRASTSCNLDIALKLTTRALWERVIIILPRFSRSAGRQLIRQLKSISFRY